jgi:7,8-dihydropterin-6-yl-methyl-4-(beta-D-ribofuranosyl)aminobenzene 5'-phosphate synthase
MKMVHFISLTLLLSLLLACSPMSDTPVQITNPANTTPTPIHAPSTELTASVAPIQLVFTPTPEEDLVDVTATAAVTNEITISGTQVVTITIIYDNSQFDHRLSSAWGFSALVEYHGYNLLFDTGGDGQILLENMRLLGIDTMEIDGVVLSHAHDDHTGGLNALLDTGVKPVVYLLESFPSTFKRQVEKRTQVQEISVGQSIAEGIWTTGEMGTAIPEQALIIQAEDGLVVVTGCAHPGIVTIIEQARAALNQPITLVLGGFHLIDKNEADIDTILSDFKRIGVERVAPCHCTGEYAIARFAAEYGDDFIQIGAGSTIHLAGINIK